MDRLRGGLSFCTEGECCVNGHCSVAVAVAPNRCTVTACRTVAH